MDEEDLIFRVNKFDILSVLLQSVANSFAVIAATFVSLSQLARAHSDYVDEMSVFQMEVSQDIEMLGGE